VNKNNLVNIGLAIAVAVLYILHFGSVNSSESISEELDSGEVSQDIAASSLVVQDTGSVVIKEAVASKVAYFNLEELVATCSYLKLKTEEMINKERRLYQSFDAKEKEFQTWYMNKQQELEDYKNKGMLVQSHMEQAQRQGQEKQQALQIEVEKEKQILMEEKQRFGIERDKIIFEAMSDLNKEAAWDYVLVDNAELRLVIPFNEANNVTKNLASIINKKFAK
jgi:phage anti-repressor protein